MSPRPSAPSLLALHAVRLLGVADERKIVVRFGLDRAEVTELLLDFEAFGWVYRAEFAGSGGWTLTEAGRAENGRQLAAELADCGAAGQVAAAHAAFLPLNARLLEAVTRWQIRPLPGEPMAVNDHTDFRWDDRVIETLGSIGRQLAPLAVDLAAVLPRFDGYGRRYADAVARVERGEHRWVDGLGLDSCHVVWMQLHEDLLATLGLGRGQED
jgi:hypothetical protein